MNFISFEYAYCLFAEATLEERCAILCTDDGARVRLAQYKYGLRGRGWTMLRGAPRRAALMGILRTSLCAGTRTVNDKRSWALPLDMTGVSMPRPPSARESYRVRDPAVLSRWKFDSKIPSFVRIGPQTCWHARISLFRSSLLRYTYVIEDKTEMYELAAWFLKLASNTKSCAQGHLYVSFCFYAHPMKLICESCEDTTRSLSRFSMQKHPMESCNRPGQLAARHGRYLPVFVSQIDTNYNKTELVEDVRCMRASFPLQFRMSQCEAICKRQITSVLSVYVSDACRTLRISEFPNVCTHVIDQPLYLRATCSLHLLQCACRKRQTD